MKSLSRLLVLLIAMSACVISQAQDKPRWALKGVESLNKERTNESYKFVKFETFGGELKQLQQERFQPLVEYLASTYGLSDENADVKQLTPGQAIASTPNDAEGDKGVQREYLIEFGGEKPVKFYAELVDEYVSFDENVDMSYDYTLYQLYAVSTNAEGNKPVFDEYDLTRSYNAKALALSIVPGLGQLYKGQNTKAYCIWGGEAVFIAGAIYFDHRRSNYAKDAQNADATIADSYRSKSKSWRNMRNIAIAGACGLYVYNLIDAAVSKGARQVIVKKPNGANLALQPTLLTTENFDYCPGVKLSLCF